MKTCRWSFFSAAVFLSLLSISTTASPVAVVPADATWKYHAAGINLGADWRAPSFNDSTWSSGTAQLGYGDGDESTIVITPDERPLTIYFRKRVWLPSGVTAASIRLLRDDGAVVYVNGVEVMRSNMPEGVVGFNTPAVSAIGGPEETSAFVTGIVSPAVFVSGTNVIAVEIHQNSIASSDMSFALELMVDFGEPPPVVTVAAIVPETREISPLVDVPIVPGVFRITRDQSRTNGPLVVPFRLTGTASNGVDYEFVASSATIPHAQAFVDVPIVAVDDLLVEGTETVVLTLLENCWQCDPVNAPKSATVSILDNDVGNTPPTVSIFQPTNGAALPSEYVFLQATADDAEDSGPLQVEFFTGSTLIGQAEFHPTLCPQNCPYYGLGWSNIPPGIHTLTARATDSAGASTLSALVTVTITGTNVPPPQPPIIVTQPQSQTVLAGSTAVFTVGVTGTPPFSYRWSRNGSTVRITSEGALILSNVQPAHAGTYRVTITNSVGVAFSSNAVLTVLGTNGPEQTVVSVFASDAHASEPGILTVVDGGQFRITRRGNLHAEIPVYFRLTGTASNGVDYSFVSNAVVIPAGATQALVNVHPLPDNAAEGAETVVLQINQILCPAIFPPPPGCYTIENGQATVTIADGPGSTNPPPAMTLIATGSVWRYNQQGIDLGTTWRGPGFNDGAWPSGPAQLGFGDGDERTVLEFPPSGLSHPTYYFRHAFNVSDASSLTSLVARLLRDDGGVVYLNGVEVFRSNMPTNAVITFDMLAPMCASGEDETSRYHEATIPPGLLAEGVNILAVEVHQCSLASADLSFDFELVARRAIVTERTTINVRALDAEATEPESGSIDTGRFIIGRHGNLDVAVPVYFTLAGTAANGIDYSFISNRIVIPAGATQAIVTVFPRADDLKEGDETVVLTLQHPICPAVAIPMPECYLVASPNRATVVIQDRDGESNELPLVTIATPTNGAVFSASADVRIEVRTQDSDGYVTEVEFYADHQKIGEASIAFIQPPLPGETLEFDMVWTNPPAGPHVLSAIAFDDGGAIGTSAPVNIVVSGSAGPVVRLFASDSQASETSGTPANPGQFTFVRSGPPTNFLPVFINVGGSATQGADYAFLSNVVVFLPGMTNVSVPVHPINDALVEPTETVVVTLLAPPTQPGSIPYIIGPPLQATVFMHDNDSNTPLARTLIAAGSTWKYRDTGEELGEGWRAPTFDDSEWAAGPAQLGFGDGDEATIVNAGSPTNRFITTYFRHAFFLTNAGSLSNLTARLLRDDGAVVYLNGVEVFRSNMPGGPVTYGTLAPIASEEPGIFHSAAIDPGLLVNGRNVVAVEVHQNSVLSTDLGFDFELMAGPGGTPVERTIITVSAIDPQAAEPGLTTVINPGQFMLRRFGNVGSTIPVQFTVGGTASNGSDYNFISNRITIPAGATQAVVTIVPRTDTLVEGTETVVLTLQPQNCPDMEPPMPGCYVVGSPSEATVFISDGPAFTNHPPVATIVAPSAGDAFRAPGNILLRANANDPDGNLQRVEFRANGVVIGNAFGSSSNAAGSGIIWSNVPAGEYRLIAVAVDSLGARGTSAPVDITVTNVPIVGTVALIPAGAVWKYRDLGDIAGSGWTTLGYDDSSWAGGPAQLGYGDMDEATVVSFGPNANEKYITTYFRRTFHVTDPAGFGALQLRLLYDDGAVVYLNGEEIFRVNMPGGTIQATTRASGVSSDNAIAEATLPAVGLVAGENVLAVEVHQVNGLSSDISFDLSLLGTADDTPSWPPVVTLVAPGEAAIFQSPTNVTLSAVASDPDGSHTVRAIEFFANGSSVGVRTNLPGADPVFPFTVVWMNPSQGAYTLTAVVSDDHGLKGTSAPVHVTVLGPLPPPGTNRELHVVGVYSGLFNGSSSPNHERGDAYVTVDRPGQAVTLYLSAYEPVLWHVAVGAGTEIERVFLGGYYLQEITGLPEGIPIIRTAHYVGYTLECAGFYLSVPKLVQLTGQEIASFQGSYTAVEPFMVDTVQDDPRLHSSYPQPVTSGLPDLSFRLAFAQRGSADVFFQDYTLRGPTGGGEVLPAMRVFADPAGRYFYGVESHDAWRIDTEANTAQEMTLPPGLPEFSWAWAGAFDTQRNRFLVSSFGGTGYLYGYSPPTETWSVVRDLDNLDLSAIGYHAPTDELFALSMMFTECSSPVLYRLSSSGEVLENIRLPIVPFGRYGLRTQIVSAGEYLVLLMEGDRSSQEPPDSRIYLFDPRTHELTLTYRSVARPPADSDRDGVADDRDLCPNTPPGIPVDSRGCPIAVADADGDGVPDAEDSCANTAPGAVVNADGCSIAQLAPCDGPWRNHAEYVAAVERAAETFQKAGLITFEQRREIVQEARRSHCGQREPTLSLPVQCPDEIRTNGCRLTLQGDGPAACIIEASTDLIHWTPISTNALQGTSIPIVDREGMTAPRRFYRLRPLPVPMMKTTP